jgi:hypothetical protein
MLHVYPNGSWYEGRVRYGVRHGYGTFYVPYDDIILCGVWKYDRFQFGKACHGHQIRYGYGDALYNGYLLNRTSVIVPVRKIYKQKRKSKRMKK